MNASPPGHGSGSVTTSKFDQNNGFHTNGGISIAGLSDSRYFQVLSSVYYLRDGILSTPSTGLNLDAFQESGGTNQLGTVPLGIVSSDQLRGGWLTASNIYQSGGVIYTYSSGQYGSYQQSGGTNQISNSLLMGGSSRNAMSGGWLSAQNLQVTGGASFLHSGGTINIPGVVTLGDGIRDEQTASGTTFGTLQLNNTPQPCSCRPMALAF